MSALKKWLSCFLLIANKIYIKSLFKFLSTMEITGIKNKTEKKQLEQRDNIDGRDI